jgi:hypothetical protein
MTRALRTGLRWLSGVALAATACTQPPSIPTSFSFNRPSSVEFVCLRVPVGSDGRIANETLTMGAEVEAFPVSQCPTVNATSSSDVQMVGGGFVGLRLFALVSQADRGELAVVNLHPRFNTGNIDTTGRVPGFTFLPVGPFAGTVAVHPAGRVTYVANEGERSVSILDNRRLLAGRRFGLIAADGRAVTLTDLPSEPVDLAIRSEGAAARVALYVLLRDGRVRVYDVTDPTAQPVFRSEARVSLARPPIVDGGTDAGLEASADGGSEASADGGSEASADGGSETDAATDQDAERDAAADAEGSDARDAAGAEDVLDAARPLDAAMDARPSTPSDAGADGRSGAGDDAGMDAGLEPESLSVERFALADDGRLFVSDRGSRIVHVLVPAGDLFALREGPPLEAGIGTTQIAVSPRLPSDGSHWVYAVTVGARQLVALDATLRDGVPVASYGTRARANTIADDPRCAGSPFEARGCPRIDPGLPVDRIPLRGPARAVGFVSVTGRSEAGEGSCDLSRPLVETCTGLPAPRLDVFRGVQAVVALSNGQVQVVDLEDPDRNCDVRVGMSVRRAFLRHIPRGGDATARPSLLGAPQLTLNGGAATPGGPNPRLAALDGAATACDENNNHCVELPRQPLAPSLVDPIAVRDATYTLRFEGQLPLRALNAAAWSPAGEPGLVRMAAPGARFCQLGAVAGDRVVLAGPSPYVDDQIRTDASVPIPPSDPACAPDECRRVFGDTNARCNREYAVRRATPDALELELPRSTINGQQRAGEPCGVVSAGGDFAGSSAEFSRLLGCCYPQATRVEVRPANRWVLSIQPAGRSLEYPHDVVERDGVCVRDPSVGPSGRVEENQPYDAGWLRLRVASGSQPTLRDAAITFRTGGGYAQLVSNAGAAGATAVRFVCGSDRVYIVDQTPAALREYSLAPFSGTRSFN